MNIQHHPSEELLHGYAAGILPEAVNLVIATHISMCDTCRAAVESYEAVGGALLDQTEGTTVSQTCFEDTLAKITGTPQKTGTPIRSDGVFPSALRTYVKGDLDAVQWKTLGRGVKQSILKTSKSATARLLHIKAGQAVPCHGHRGLELTLVLQGAFRDETDRFARGDMEIADPHLEHTPHAEEGKDCICLAVTDAPLRFNSLIPRLLQPVFRI